MIPVSEADRYPNLSKAPVAPLDFFSNPLGTVKKIFDFSPASTPAYVPTTATKPNNTMNMVLLGVGALVLIKLLGRK